jgi:integrin beta 3
VPAAAVPSHPQDRPEPAATEPTGRTAAAVRHAAATEPTGRTAAAVRHAAATEPDVAAEERVGGIRGARSELRKQLRGKRRLPVITLVTLSVLVLGLLPLFFGIRAATRDPVFNSLDALEVPGWAATEVDDRSSGSRWCFLDCRFRERTAQSDRPFEETAKVYSDALITAGWKPWQVGECPEQPVDGRYTCWQRDEFTLDLWVRLPECAVDAVAAQDPAALPSTGPDGVVETANPKSCVGSTVSIKVQNAITDQRGKPEQPPDPGLVGETPDPVLSNDPLLDPTPSPS